MADQVQLGVMLTGAEQAIANLAQIDAYVKGLNGKNIKITVSSTGITRAANQAEKLNTNLTSASTSAQKIGTAAPQAMQKTAKATETAAGSAQKLSLGFGSIAANLLKFQAVNLVINGTAKAFKFAFQEMKNVDTEMVNIRKVTGFSADEMERLEKSAYSLASKYGRTASEVLEGGTTFARAGYTDQIEQLSELSLLLQNVGDLQADDASKFIVATDKAYKLGGSYENLIAIIDGLDNITNKNATDMQKMTDGMTIAGSVFAESGESIETFAALLGTATANTQRSGSEVARGLRTILMNLRQIRGETEDGELIDGESIAAASKALKDYAGISTMENGQLRKASDVLEELAGKWDDLSETQRAAIAEAVAGKRQANILMSLMGDWESVTKMMQEYENSAGTAAKENAAYMDSWAAKTEQVKASWSELIATIANTDDIKLILDAITGGLQGINDQFSSVQERSIKYTDEANGKVVDLTKSYNELFGEGSRYEELIRNVGRLTDAEKVELGVLIQLRKEKEDELNAAKEAAAEAEKQATAARSEEARNQKGITMLQSANKDFFLSGDVSQYITDVSKALRESEQYYQSLQNIRAQGGELVEDEQKFIRAYEYAVQTFADGGNAIEVLGKFVAAASYATGSSWEEATEQAREYQKSTKEMYQQGSYTWKDGAPVFDITVETTGYEETSSLLDEIKKKAEEGAQMTVEIIASKPEGFAKGTKGAPGGPALVNEKGPELLAANGLAWIAGGGKPTVAMLPQGAQVYTASQTRRMLGGIPAFAAGTVVDELGGGSNGKDLYVPLSDAEPTEIIIRTLPQGRKTYVTPGEADPIAKRDSFSPETYSPNFKTLEKQLSDRLKNLDLQAKLAENEEDFLKAMQIYGEAQDYISKLLDTYRAAGYADDSDEVLRLANMGYDYAAKQLGGYDDLQSKLIEALNALTDATEDANALQERREAVDKAREALANAEKQRTVRIFNPVTGQWEWVANAADVQKAKENLKNAEDSLQKEELEQAINAIKNANPEDLANMTIGPAILDKLFGGTPEQQSAFLNALNGAYGGASYLGSAAAQTAFNQGNTIGTQYNLNGINITPEQAATMTIKDLLNMLQGLKIM